MRFLKSRPILKKIFYALIYGITSGVAINCFLEPNGFNTGGITGLSQLISFVGNKLFEINIPLWFLILIFNLPLSIMSYFTLGKQFTVFSFISTAISALTLKIIPLYPLTNDPMLSAIFGGVIFGFGIGLCFRAGFSTGGVDFIIFFIRKKRGQTVGTLSTILNGCITIAVGIFYGIESALYSLISIFVSNQLVNFFYAQQYKVTVSIFTQKKNSVINALHKNSIHGISYIENVFGGYTDRSNTLIVSVVSKYELFLLKEVIMNADPEAFVNVQPTSEVLGLFNENPIE